MVDAHRVTLRNVELVSRECPGKRKKGKPVFTLQPLGLVTLPRGVHWRALKRVRFAADRVDDNAEVPEPMPVSAPSVLPVEASPSSQVQANSTESALSASEMEVLDQVMGEGASCSSNTCTKRSSDDNSNRESEAKRFNADHSTRDVVMFLDDTDVCQVAEQCREVCRRKGTFLVDVNDWDSDSRDNLRAFGSDGAIVACSSGDVTRELMSNESRLLGFLAAARNSNGDLQKKTIAKCVRQHKCGLLGTVGRCEEFDPILVHRAKMEDKDFIDKMGVYDVVPRSDAAKKGCPVSEQGVER